MMRSNEIPRWAIILLIAVTLPMPIFYALFIYWFIIVPFQSWISLLFWTLIISSNLAILLIASLPELRRSLARLFRSPVEIEPVGILLAKIPSDLGLYYVFFKAFK